MTCIAGMVAANGDIIVGGDSAGVAGLDLAVRRDPKVFTKGNFIYGFTSSFRMGQLIQYRFDAPDHDPRKDVDTYLRTDWIDALRKCFDAGGYSRRNNGSEEAGTFLVGYRGRLFFVDSDYQIGEALHPFFACGCGQSLALGAMFALQESAFSEEDKIGKALECAEQYSAGVRRPFVIKRLQAEGK